MDCILLIPQAPKRVNFYWLTCYFCGKSNRHIWFFGFFILLAFYIEYKRGRSSKNGQESSCNLLFRFLLKKNQLVEACQNGYFIMVHVVEQAYKQWAFTSSSSWGATSSTTTTTTSSTSPATWKTFLVTTISLLLLETKLIIHFSFCDIMTKLFIPFGCWLATSLRFPSVSYVPRLSRTTICFKDLKGLSPTTHLSSNHLVDCVKTWKEIFKMTTNLCFLLFPLLFSQPKGTECLFFIIQYPYLSSMWHIWKERTKRQTFLWQEPWKWK